MGEEGEVLCLRLSLLLFELALLLFFCARARVLASLVAGNRAQDVIRHVLILVTGRAGEQTGAYLANELPAEELARLPGERFVLGRPVAAALFCVFWGSDACVACGG